MTFFSKERFSILACHHQFFIYKIWFFSKLIGEEDSRIQGVKGSSECKRLNTDDINTCVFCALTL